MLAIRMQCKGRAHYPVYRIVVQESQRHPLSGRIVADLGSFNPHTKEVTLDKEKVEFYLKNGAQPSTRVARVLSKNSIKLPAWVKTATEKAAKYGIKVVYHNHAHEFEPLDGVRPIDEIAKWCLLEPDTYWVFHAGDNPPEFLRRYRSRIGLIHLKDGVDGKGTSIGDGANDLKSIVEAAKDIGVEWVIAEIENAAEDAESVRDAENSFAYMTEKLGL